MDIEIETKPLGRLFATVTLRLGPPHNQVIDLGTYGRLGLSRMAQELEHCQDWMEQVAGNLQEER